jgi:hypothetical protein
LYVWRRGEHLPDDPAAVAKLAGIFVQTWAADRSWINQFLASGEYGPRQAVEALLQALFGSPEDVSPRSFSQAMDKPEKALGIPGKTALAGGTYPQNATTKSPETQFQEKTGHRVAMAVFNMLIALFFRVLEKTPAWLIDGVFNKLERPPQPAPPTQIALFPVTCGDKGINLAEQRLLVSSAFGAYFTGLLERDHSYVNLKGQIDVQTRPEQAGLDPLQSLYWALQYPRGPRLIIIAAEGGMGKSTLAARLIRCLFEERAVDLILGDSAKTQVVDPISGKIMLVPAGYYDPSTFYKQLCAQLGLPAPERTHAGTTLQHIRDRLEGRRAVILVDNLESVSRDTELLKAVQQLASRDNRIIVTSRAVSSRTVNSANILLVRLKPLTHFETARDFLQWHIKTHAAAHPDLAKLQQDLKNEKLVRPLLARTGGIPLLVQLVLSDVARFSWTYLDGLPDLFGPDLLDFLYQERWQELERRGEAGRQAQALLHFIGKEQYLGHKITFDRLNQWVIHTGLGSSSQAALQLLQERFLIVNHDLQQGHFAIFPSLAEFLSKQNPS